MRSFKIILVFLSFSLVIIQPCLAIKEETADRYGITGDLEREERPVEEYAVPREKALDFYMSIDVQQGFDNNVDLDPQKHMDGFIQGIGNAEINYRTAWEGLTLIGGVDLFEMVYYKYNDNNIFEAEPYAGFNWDIIPGLTWRNKTTFDYYSYPNEKESTFLGWEVHTSLRHFILEWLYHEPQYEYIRRWYPDWKVSKNTGQIDNANRLDDRHKFKYTFGMYFPTFMIKCSNEVYYNDSNDMFQDYYDYWVYRVRPSIMYFLTDNLYTDVSFVYRHYWYDDRRSTEKSWELVRDNTFIATLALYYDVTKNITLEATYSYTENTSNDPFNKFTDSIVSGGIYFSF